jgi:hypothetical protein
MLPRASWRSWRRRRRNVEPADLGDELAVTGIANVEVGLAEDGEEVPRARLLQEVGREVPRDGVEPRAETLRVLVMRSLLEDPQEGFLRERFGLVPVADEAVQVAGDRNAVARKEEREGLLVAPLLQA